jgi:polyphosphate kinase
MSAEPDPNAPLLAPAARSQRDPAHYLNRELSWLDFNRRVLNEAEDPSNPLLERLKFVGIFGSNLDEFFMKRIGGLKQQLASNVRGLTLDGRSPRQQLEEINAAVRPLVGRQHRLFLEELVPELGRHGIQLLRWAELSEPEQRHLRVFFERSVFPVVTPLALDPAHPFPFISNLSLSLAVAVRHPATAQERFARLKVPGGLPRWIQLPDGLRFVTLEDIIAHNLERLFRGMEIVACNAFRVTRNADVERNEEAAEDLLEAIQAELRERRFATVVRLEVEPEMPGWMRALLCEELDIEAGDVFEAPPPLALADLRQLAALPLLALRAEPWRPATHARLRPGPSGEPPDIFRVLQDGDLLVHHPYDSFASSVQRFIERAAEDPAVVAIKQTLYRTSSNSPTVRALARAAERGKQVAVTVELKARFDEARNIEWAQALEEAGAHVAYGVVGLKTHAKVTLVVRQEADGLRCYSHIGTGNYNTDTAGLYTDLGLLSARPELGEDLGELFNFLTGYSAAPVFSRLLVAPVNMRQRFLELVAGEVAHQQEGRGGRVIAKMNSLEDPEIVDALYWAAGEGVRVDLVVRGICRLRPGLAGHSDTVRVLSIVGRFLEHARIYHFANGGRPLYYIGSADWMSRNLDYRVEAIVPVEAPELQAELQSILDLQLGDNLKAWDLQSDGAWRQRRPAPGEAPRSSQRLLMQRALRR